MTYPCTTPLIASLVCSNSVTHTYKLAQQLSFTVLLKENEKFFLAVNSSSGGRRKLCL